MTDGIHFCIWVMRTIEELRDLPSSSTGNRLAERMLRETGPIPKEAR